MKIRCLFLGELVQHLEYLGLIVASIRLAIVPIHRLMSLVNPKWS